MRTLSFYQKNKKATLRKRRGQGMVEFALVLPILLMVVYGLLETGRLLFIYGSTVTAARQAARYGSATGRNDSNIPFYRDCTGIDEQVNRLGFIHTYSDINVTYDRGLDTSGNAVAISGISAAANSDTCESMNDTTLQNGDRIKVQVVTQWTPIVAVIPSWQGFTITSSAERTILTEVAIGVTPSGGTWGGPSGTLTLSVSSTTTSFDSTADVISYTYTITNTSLVTLNGPFTITDTRATTSCSGASASLAVGATTTCTGTANPGQPDLDAGFLTNSASAAGSNSTSNQAGVSVPAVQYKTVSMLDITPFPDVATVPGIAVTYTYRFQNSGNVTLTSPYTISDNKVSAGDINCSGAATPLVPGAITECTGTYIVTNTDVSNGTITSTAAVKAQFSGVDTSLSNYANANVYTSPILLTIVAPTNVNAAGEVTYQYKLKNVSTVTYYAEYHVLDTMVTGITCPSDSIDPGDTITCEGKYPVTQAQLDAGLAISNQATSTANSGAISSNTASASMTFKQEPNYTLTATPSSTLVTGSLPVSINYTYAIKNTGNITLTGPFTITTTGLYNNPTCTVNGTIAPNATLNCVLNYPLQQLDKDAGSIVSTASTTIEINGNFYPTQDNADNVITYNAARITLSITAPTSFTTINVPLNVVFKLQNTGNASVTLPAQPVTVSSPSGITPSCPATASLGLGEFIECTASMTPTTAANLSINASGTANSGVLTVSQSATVNYTFACYAYRKSDVVVETPTSKRNMYMNFVNTAASAGSITIGKIEVTTWDDTKTINKIEILNGSTVEYTSTVSNSNPTATFSGLSYVIPNDGVTRKLKISFSSNYTAKGTEKIEITFTQTSCANNGILISNDATYYQP